MNHAPKCPDAPLAAPVVQGDGRARRALWAACLGVALIPPLAAVNHAAGQPAPEPATEPTPAQPPAGEPAAGQPAAGQAAAPNAQLVAQVENFYHYAEVANYPAAKAVGDQIVAANPDPQAVLDAFREVHERRSRPNYTLDQLFLRWQRTPEIADVTGQLVGKVNEGRLARATDPAFIAEQIERLNKGQAAYGNGLAQLRNSGEYAVPIMIQYLLNPERAEFHADIRRAMRDLGVDMINPLLAATQMENEQVIASLLVVLGDLGYDAAVPYLLEKVETSQSALVKNAAQNALTRLGFTGGSNAAQQFNELARKLYYQQSAIRPSARLGTATIWRWGGQQAGLMRTDVPPQIFDEVMAMRAAGRAMALGQGMDESLALWLASNYRREGELKEGETDPTRPENAPSAGYYGTQAGTRYLQAVLERTQADRGLSDDRRYNAADVALRAIKSLQEIVGRGNIGTGETPLTQAMRFPDRRVRIEAAMALAQALPTQGFSGQEQVVPLLAEALSQTGQPTVVLILPNVEELNTITQALTAGGYRVVGTDETTKAIDQAQGLSSVEVVVVDAKLGDRSVDQLLSNAESNPKLNGAAKLVLTETSQSRYENLKLTNPTLATTTSRGAAELTAAMEQARTAVGGLPLDPAAATELATRSGNLLKQIGIGNSIFNLDSGSNVILAALDDARPEIQTLGGEVVALLDSGEAQAALLDKALTPDAPPEVKVSLFNSLATSAQRYGNRLDAGAVDRLLAAAANRDNLDVQAAAAAAVGAFNLPADQARRLIVEETAASQAPARQ